MRASRPRDHHSHCLNCYLRREICICPILPTVQTRTEFLILRHVREAGRSSNTGRLVALSMPNSRIVSCGGGERIGISLLDEEWLRDPGSWLLWPDGPGTRTDMPHRPLPDRVVVLDATWRQARRLYNRMPVLRSMPRLILPAALPCRDRLRRQHRPDGMSTLEAVAAAVATLEGAHVAKPLEKLYDEVVRRKNFRRWGVKSS